MFFTFFCVTVTGGGGRPSAEGGRIEGYGEGCPLPSGKPSIFGVLMFVCLFNPACGCHIPIKPVCLRATERSFFVHICCCFELVEQCVMSYWRQGRGLEKAVEIAIGAIEWWVRGGVWRMGQVSFWPLPGKKWIFTKNWRVLVNSSRLRGILVCALDTTWRCT